METVLIVICCALGICLLVLGAVWCGGAMVLSFIKQLFKLLGSIVMAFKRTKGGDV